MLQRMSVNFALLIAASVFISTADHATAATDPMNDPSVQTQITKFNDYRDNKFIPGMVEARFFMPKMKQDKPLIRQMTRHMLPVVRSVIIKNIQDSIDQPDPFPDYQKSQVPNAPLLWPR